MEERNFYKGTSQLSKKATKNAARLPRTAGLRTITELTDELTRAGYDPSRIEERAKMLAKIQGAKRRRDDDSDEDDVDMDSAGGEGSEDEAMEVDGARKAAKRAKTTSGRVTTKRVPASDRQMTGLKNAQQLSKARELHKFAQRPRNALAKAGEADRVIKTKLVSLPPFLTCPYTILTLPPSQNISSPESARVEKRTDDDRMRHRTYPAPYTHTYTPSLRCCILSLFCLVLSPHLSCIFTAFSLGFNH